MLKYLRIAVTALSLAACVLLVAVWVRSYWWENSVCVIRPNAYDLCLTTFLGELYFDLIKEPFGEPSGRGTTNEWSFNNSNIRQKWGPDNFNDREIMQGFSYHNDNEDLVVTVPLWSLILLVAGIAVVPWLAWSRRFSLRTLLIATTLIAVGLGVFAVLN